MQDKSLVHDLFGSRCENSKDMGSSNDKFLNHYFRIYSDKKTTEKSMSEFLKATIGPPEHLTMLYGAF